MKRYVKAIPLVFFSQKIFASGHLVSFFSNGMQKREDIELSRNLQMSMLSCILKTYKKEKRQLNIQNRIVVPFRNKLYLFLLKFIVNDIEFNCTKQSNRNAVILVLKWRTLLWGRGVDCSAFYNAYELVPLQWTFWLLSCISCIHSIKVYPDHS